jgi:hypothetical protein
MLPKLFIFGIDITIYLWGLCIPYAFIILSKYFLLKLLVLWTILFASNNGYFYYFIVTPPLIILEPFFRAERGTIPFLVMIPP